MKTKFDKIYVLSLVTNKERQEFISYQFNQLGLDFEFVYGIDFFNFNLRFPDLFDNLPNRPKDLGCTMTHYQAIAQAYYLGYKSVLIFEDDVCLNKDILLWEDMLNNIPEDADFITFDYRNYDWLEEVNIDNIKNNIDKRYVNICENEMFFGGAMYGLTNRNVIKLFLESQHNEVHMSDHVANIFMPNTTDNKCVKLLSTKCMFVDQFTYEKIFINNDYKLVPYYDNLYIRMEENKKKKKYNKKRFFKPNQIHKYSREIIV